jgi:hypothetical protein
MFGKIRRRHALWAATAVALVTGLLLASSAWASGDDWLSATGRPCAYSQHSVGRLTALGTTVGHPFDCALVFSDEAPNWDAWTHPWFTTSTGDQNWVAWKKADPGRRLIISPGLVPLGTSGDWRARGAAGRFDSYYRTLGTQLVKAGFGDSVLRIGHEGNGNWTHDWFGDNPQDQRDWTATWRRAAAALKSTPGSHFVTDWNVAAGFDNVPLAWYYPGDDVVDLIGFDYYDLDAMTTGARSGDPERWNQQYANTRNGPAEVIAFANEHRKPISIPEWGLVPRGNIEGRALGGGDNPQFVDGISSVIANNRVSYSGYFDDDVDGTRLPIGSAPRALDAYRHQLQAKG